MIRIDEDALTCDFAETYHILDFRGLQPSKAAVLSFGLPETSRIKTVLGGASIPMDLLMQATTIDYLALLAWFKTEDGRKNRHRPKSFVDALMGRNKKETQSFSTVEAFEAARARILGKDDS